MALREEFASDARQLLEEVGFPIRSGSLTGYGRHAREVIEISGGGGYPGTMAERDTLVVVRADFPLDIGADVEIELTPGTWSAFKVAHRMPSVSGPYSNTLQRYALEEA